MQKGRWPIRLLLGERFIHKFLMKSLNVQLLTGQLLIGYLNLVMIRIGKIIPKHGKVLLFQKNFGVIMTPPDGLLMALRRGDFIWILLVRMVIYFLKAG